MQLYAFAQRKTAGSGERQPATRYDKFALCFVDDADGERSGFDGSSAEVFGHRGARFDWQKET